MNSSSNARLLAAALCLGAGLAPVVAAAGPCSDQIAELGKTLSQSPSLGTAPTTGTLTGSGPGSAPSAAASDPATSPDPATSKGTSADSRIGGTAGTKELDSASSQVATSAQDVRRQQEGLPTAAATAAAKDHGSVETAPGLGQGKSPDDRTAAAKSELERAVALDRKDDSLCLDSLSRVRNLMKKS